MLDADAAPPAWQGDNDPVDVVEIGSATLDMGGVYEARLPRCAKSDIAAVSRPFHHGHITQQTGIGSCRHMLHQSQSLTGL